MGVRGKIYQFTFGRKVLKTTVKGRVQSKRQQSRGRVRSYFEGKEQHQFYIFK